MTEDERIARSGRAFNEMLELQEVFDKLDAATVKALTETPIGADAKITKLHMTLHNLAGIRQAMREMIDDGLMAQSALAAAGLTRN
jgi:hypothetical protein